MISHIGEKLFYGQEPVYGVHIFSRYGPNCLHAYYHSVDGTSREKVKVYGQTKKLLRVHGAVKCNAFLWGC